MDEAEWAACGDPAAMLLHLARRVTARKRRLFAVACCRRLQFLADDVAIGTRKDDYRRAVEVAERYADRKATKDELREAFWAADDSGFANYPTRFAAEDESVCDPFRDVAEAGRGATAGIWRQLLVCVRECGTDRTPAARRRRDRRFSRSPHPDDERAEAAAQAALLRCLFGGPEPAAFDPAWRTKDAVSLAKGIYEERAFDRLPVLGDALEEAGCTDADLLAHCRGGGEHAWGCRAVDAVLRKS